MNREGERGKKGERETERHRDRQTDREQTDGHTDRQAEGDRRRQRRHREGEQAGNPSNVYLAHTHSLFKPEEFEENYIFGQCLEKFGNFKTIVHRKSAEGGGGGGGAIKTICVIFFY